QESRDPGPPREGAVDQAHRRCGRRLSRYRLWRAERRCREGRPRLMPATRPARASRTLLEAAPEIAEQFDAARNPGVILETVTAGSPKKLWWNGACGHAFESSPYNRVKEQGCPY